MTASYLCTDPQALYRAIGDDADACCALADMYLEAAPRTRAALLQALDRRDLAHVRRECHELRGTAVIFGAVTLAGLLASCESVIASDARLPDPDQQDTLFALLDRVTAEVARARGDGWPPA